MAGDARAQKRRRGVSGLNRLANLGDVYAPAWKICAGKPPAEPTSSPFHKGTGEFGMFSIITGAALVFASGAAFWRLLPDKGEVNPLVRNSDVGSMITIAIMAGLTFGVVILCAGLFG